MGKFRKKPVVIEAHQWNGTTWEDRDEFVKETGWPYWHIGSISGSEKVGMIIPTLEGDHLAEKGDWIIKGINGEFYPCKPDIFEKSYEEVTED